MLKHPSAHCDLQIDSKPIKLYSDGDVIKVKE